MNGLNTNYIPRLLFALILSIAAIQYYNTDIFVSLAALLLFFGLTDFLPSSSLPAGIAAVLLIYLGYFEVPYQFASVMILFPSYKLYIYEIASDLD